MNNTPSKIDLLNSTLSPVRVNSPSTVKKSPKLSTNQTLVIQRTTTILKQLITNHEKWNEYQKRGLFVCNSIEHSKSKVLETTSVVDSLYPDELKGLCDKLQTIVENFKTIASYCKKAESQLKALNKLNENATEPIFKTWAYIDFIHFTEKINSVYNNEIQIKSIINENIAHSENKASLTYHVCVWEYPKYVNSDTDLIFQILSKECFVS